MMTLLMCRWIGTVTRAPLRPRLVVAFYDPRHVPHPRS